MFDVFNCKRKLFKILFEVNDALLTVSGKVVVFWGLATLATKKTIRSCNSQGTLLYKEYNKKNIKLFSSKLKRGFYQYKRSEKPDN